MDNDATTKMGLTSHLIKGHGKMALSLDGLNSQMKRVRDGARG